MDQGIPIGSDLKFSMRSFNSLGGGYSKLFRSEVFHEQFQFLEGEGEMLQMSSDFDGELLRSEVSKFSMRSSNGGRGILGELRLEVPIQL